MHACYVIVGEMLCCHDVTADIYFLPFPPALSPKRRKGMVIESSGERLLFSPSFLQPMPLQRGPKVGVGLGGGVVLGHVG